MSPEPQTRPRPLASTVLFIACLALSVTLMIAGCSSSDANENNTQPEDSQGNDTQNDTNTGDTAERDAQSCTVESETHTGEGTYYDADGSGACSFDASPDDLMVAALNPVDYAASANCGACAEVTGPNGSVTVRVVDLCPGCAEGDVDLSAEAFEQIADPVDGRVPIEWRYVPCAVQSPIQYHFKDGTNEWWLAVQVRNHRYPVASLEVYGNQDRWQISSRAEYNYFIIDEGAGPGPFQIRVTDIFGHVLEDSGIPFQPEATEQGSEQFPMCE